MKTDRLTVHTILSLLIGLAANSQLSSSGNTGEGLNTGTLPAAQTTASLTEYVSSSARAIKRNWHPPKGNEGYALAVNFRVHRDGSVCDIQIVQQHNRLQLAVDAARAAILNAAPLPLPDGAMESVLMQAHFRYDLTNTSPWLFLIDERNHTATLFLSEEQKMAMKSSSEQIAELQPYLAEVEALCKKAWLAKSQPEEDKPIGALFWIKPDGKPCLFTRIHGDVQIRDSDFGSPTKRTVETQTILDAAPFPPLPTGYSQSICVKVLFRHGQDPHVWLQPSFGLQKIIPPEPVLREGSEQTPAR